MFARYVSFFGRKIFWPKKPLLIAALDMLICPKCNYQTHEDYDRCVNCNADIGSPNVRRAEAERSELNDRYDAAMRDAAGRGAAGVAMAFEQAAAQSQAVINIDFHPLKTLIENERNHYANYYELVRGGVRSPADPDNDRDRAAADALLFGSTIPGKIAFAALSIDGRGLISYGKYTLTLREGMIADRISLLEENSYTFVKRHDVSLNRPTPKGYRAVWADRGRLAAAKLAPQLSDMTQADDFARILLFSDGNRANDRFIEAHLYGSFTRATIEKVAAPQGRQIGEAKLRELARKAGIAWEQV